jgi:hypothetical protein
VPGVQVEPAKEAAMFFIRPFKQKEPYRVGHGGYVSEFSQFLDSFLELHPEVPEDQRRGWYIWWDKDVDLKEEELEKSDSVPTPGYYYR